MSRLAARFGIAVATGLTLASPVRAQILEGSDPRLFEPLPTLPETLRGTVAQGGPQPRPGALERIGDVTPALGACWAPPPGLTKLELVEVTVRFSFRRDGSVIGTPRVTFATLGAETRARDVLRTAAIEAIEHCTPLKFSPALGGAIAGRPFAIRFIYEGPKGRGV